MWRILIYAIAGVAASLACLRYGVAFADGLRADVFTAKLALIGIMLAVGTFQYQLFWSLINAVYGHFRAANVRAAASPQHAVERQELSTVALKYLVPHTEGILWCIFTMVILLAIGCAADTYVMLGSDGARGWPRAMSVGFFAACVLPFAEIMTRYWLSLKREFAHWKRVFQVPK